MRCSRCGEDLVITEHEDLTGHLPTCPPSHHYCPNCDNGLCCAEC